MKIAYITMIKDECDLIYYQLNYYKNIGFKDFYIIDNGSTDGTLDLVSKFISENPQIKVYLEIDNNVDYWQYVRINKLANLAYNEGCDWILPVDADELLFHNETFTNFNIYDFLNNVTEGDYIKFQWWYYRPTDNDDANEKNPFLRINHRDKIQQCAFTKVFLKWNPRMIISQGNHCLHDENIFKRIDELSNKIYFAHFWRRSLEQERKKMINLGEGYRNLVNTFNSGHFALYERYLKEGDNYLKEILNYYKNEFEVEKFEFKKENFI